jgi:DNA-directed RNA polymerase
MRRVLDATATACPSVQAALGWLKRCAAPICKDGTLLAWTNPMGLEIHQPYVNARSASVRTAFGELSFKSADGCPSKFAKQVSSFAPNFVHSVDSAHMMSVAIACKDARIRLAAVHDSAWTHAADMDTLARIVREQFVAIHEQPLLHNLADELRARYGKPIDEPPLVGTLDIQSALTSQYLFA